MGTTIATKNDAPDERAEGNSDRPPDSLRLSAPFEYSWVNRSKGPRRASYHGTPPPQRLAVDDPAAWRRLLTGDTSPDATVVFRHAQQRLAGGLARGYWRSAWAFAALIVVFVALWGQWPDKMLATGWLGLTFFAYWYSKRSNDAAVALHLVAAFPITLAYVELTGDTGMRSVMPSIDVYLLLAFPGLLLVAFWGRRGLFALALLAAGCESVLLAGRHPAGLVAGALVPAALAGAAMRSAILRASELENLSARSSCLDPVTGLVNRRSLYQHVRAWQAALGGNAAAMIIGINRFSAVNTILGRSAADELLALVAQRLTQAAGPHATVARLGGDEFLIFVPGVAGDVARNIAKQLLAGLRGVFSVRGHAVHVSACVGIAAYPDHGKDVEDLVRHADAAMQRAKKSGNSIDEISWHGSDRVSQAMMLEADLRQAVLDEQLAVEFQPVLELATGKFVGAEALARWHHAELGTVGPDVFIRIAEEAGIVSAIDQLVMRRALACRELWARNGWDGWVSVNLSAESFGHPAVVATLAGALERTGTSAGKLVIEVTESRAMRNPEVSAAVLANMKQLGVGVALDDFGMGYSSLAYLKIFPVDHLKLDRMFVQGIGVDVRDEHLLEALIELAHRRGVTIVAEGVETEAQLRWLTEHGCEYAQGFLLGRSMPASAFAALVAGPLADRARPPGPPPH